MDTITRRAWLRSGAAGCTAALAPVAWLASPSPAQAAAPARLQPLSPLSVPKYVNALFNPLEPAFRAVPGVGSAYALTILEFWADFGLGAGIPPATAWGYAGLSGIPTSPGPTFEVSQGQPITVAYVNGLSGIPQRLPVDTTLDWANPGGLGGTAPVPVSVHLHGGASASLSDGLPDAWFTPNDQYVGRVFGRPYVFENSQEAAHLWYHDHTLGITRTNAYMGLAGLYFIRDANENQLRATNVLPSFPYEVPLVLQDRMFYTNGQMYYPASSTKRNLPVPTHLPEFFGDIMVVNGKAWPRMPVEQRKVRFRILNASDSRVYELRLLPPRGVAAPPMWVIGNELGLLDTPQVPSVKGVPGTLVIAPGERYDVIVDFTAVPVGTRVLLGNSAPTPYPAGTKVRVGIDDQLMAFDVVPLTVGAAPNASVALGTPLRPLSGALAPVSIPPGTTRRRIFLFEGTDRFGRLQTMLGPVDPVTSATGATVQGTLVAKDPISERPALGSTEVWEFYNTTVDAHPMHLHLVDFRILDRQPFTGTLTAKLNTDGSNGAVLSNVTLNPLTPAVTPLACERGRKDTVLAYPGEVTRLLVNFGRRGEYVYHCHILSHEDHEMMRPYQVA